MLSRRAFLASTASLAVTAGITGTQAAMGPNDKFDLLVKGGDVLDPSQSLRGRRDIGIRFGVIEAVEPDIAEARALRVINASGKLVTPGLVDLHSHVYPYGSAIGLPADESVVNQCATTCVSAGDAGANNFAAFRRFIVGQTRTRLYAFVHIANIGLTPFPIAELYNIDFAQVDACAKTIGENSDIALGAKVRMSENVIAKHGTEPLKRAILACEQSGTPAKIMCHIGGVETGALMSQILDLLRPGDILTHAYSGAPNIAGAFTNIVQDGKLLPAALAAKQRGVIFDVGHSGGSFDYTVAEVAIRGDAGPIRSRRTSTPFPATRRACLTSLGSCPSSWDSVLRSSRLSRWRQSIRRKSSTACQSLEPCRSARPVTSRSWNWSKARYRSSIPGTTNAKGRLI